MKTRQEIIRHILAVSATILLIFAPGLAYAQQSSSGHYSVNEVIFGTGGQDYCPKLTGETSIGAYCAIATAGELTIGNTKSTQFQAYGGFNTARAPFIEVDMLQPVVDLGVIKTTKTGYGTAQLQVKAYLTSGYAMQIYGSTPTNGTYSIAAMSSLGASTMGTEQFGMNLAANSVVLQPAMAATNFGSAPTQDPDTTFAFGYANNDTGSNMVYNTANSFKYTSGDIIAKSSASSSFTKYTLSYIMNITALTPGGSYSTNQTIVATATY